MRRIAEKVSKELKEDNDVVGVILTGSTVTGQIHEESDIDLIVVTKLLRNQLPPHRIQEVEGCHVEISYTSVESFRHTFDDEQYRNDSAWFGANFCMQMLRDGLIMEDPYKELTKWNEKALHWRWRSSEIQPLFTQSDSLLDSCQDRLEKGDAFAALVTLRDAFTPFSSALMMRLNLPSYWRPKDQSLQIPKLEGKYPELVRLFYEVHDLKYVRIAWLWKCIEVLTAFMRRYDWEQGLEQHVKGVRGCLRRGNVSGALLSARRATYFLGIEILNKKGDKTPPYMFHAPTQLKVIDWTKKEELEFYGFYREIHRADRLNMSDLFKITKRMHRNIERNARTI